MRTGSIGADQAMKTDWLKEMNAVLDAQASEINCELNKLQARVERCQKELREINKKRSSVKILRRML